MHRTTLGTNALIFFLAFAIPSPKVCAQDTDRNPDAAKQSQVQRAEEFRATSVDRSYALHNQPTQPDQNEVLTAIRNMTDPMTKIFLVPSQNIIVVHAPDSEQQRIAKLIATLDQPHPRYRLSFTLTELDGSRTVGVQHYSMTVLDGQRFQMKEGSRIPISTGGSQFTYLDVGMNFDVMLTAVQGGGVLKSKVEQSSIAADTVSPNNPDPLVRQTLLEGTTSLAFNKPEMLGSLDVPASTHHVTVEATMEPAN